MSYRWLRVVSVSHRQHHHSRPCTWCHPGLGLPGLSRQSSQHVCCPLWRPLHPPGGGELRDPQERQGEGRVSPAVHGPCGGQSPGGAHSPHTQDEAEVKEDRDGG